MHVLDAVMRLVMTLLAQCCSGCKCWIPSRTLPVMMSEMMLVVQCCTVATVVVTSVGCLVAHTLQLHTHTHTHNHLLTRSPNHRLSHHPPSGTHMNTYTRTHTALRCSLVLLLAHLTHAHTRCRDRKDGKGLSRF